jgi:hypothetical protein
MKVGVVVNGTLDNRNYKDKGWVVEMAIPLDVARGKEKAMKNVPPVVGTEWRVNFFRMDLPQGHPQVGTAWSPPMVGDFHALDRFGTLVFGDEKGQSPQKADKAEAKKADAAKDEASKDAKKTETGKDEAKKDAKAEPKKTEASPEQRAEEAKRKARSASAHAE